MDLLFGRTRFLFNRCVGHFLKPANLKCFLQESYNFTNLQKFIQLFPASALSRMLKGYFKYVSIPILDEDNPDPDREEDPFDMMLVGLNLILGFLC